MKPNTYTNNMEIIIMAELLPVPNEEIEEAIESEAFDVIEKNISMASLPKGLEYVLRVEMEDFVSESPRATAEDIAERAGVHSQTVFRAHRDARFIAVKDRIQDIYFQGKAERFYSALLKSADSGKVGAIKLGLEITGKHVTRIESRNVNINTDMSTDGTFNLDNAVDKFLVMLGNKGWSLEMIADKWRLLKSKQAF